LRRNQRDIAPPPKDAASPTPNEREKDHEPRHLKKPAKHTPLT
jgi:hypothetical protein